MKCPCKTYECYREALGFHECEFREETYETQPVRTIKIKESEVGVHLLGIPTVIYRF